MGGEGEREGEREKDGGREREKDRGGREVETRKRGTERQWEREKERQRAIEKRDTVTVSAVRVFVCVCVGKSDRKGEVGGVRELARVCVGLHVTVYAVSLCVSLRVSVCARVGLHDLKSASEHKAVKLRTKKKKNNKIKDALISSAYVYRFSAITLFRQMRQSRRVTA